MRRHRIPGEIKLADASRDIPAIRDVVLLDVTRPLNEQDENLSAAQLDQLGRTAPILLAAHAIGGLGLIFTLYSKGESRLAIMAIALVLLTIAIDAAFMAMGRMELLKDRPPYVGGRVAAAYGALIGLCWGTLLLVGVPPHAVAGEMVAGIAFASTGTAAALVMVAVPIVLVIHWFILICAVAFAFGSVIVGLTLAGIFACIAAVAITQARRRIVDSRRRHDEDRRGRTARLLLAEFEEGGKAWLWETDTDGRLTYISNQLSISLTGEQDSLLGSALTDLVISEDGSAMDSVSGERTLGFHLSTRLAFSELTVRARTEGAARWWSLSGRPAFDDFHRFIGFRGIGADLTEMRRSEAEVKRLARYDALTGLPNRVVMRQTLDQAVRGDPNKDVCALFLLDLDRFKSVNDTLGHPVGDALLRQVAERLSREINDHGRVGRLGGDEFNVVLPGMIDRRALSELADRVIDALSQPYLIEGSTISIGASIGIALAPEHGDCADSLVRNADLALYAAKAAGKGVHRFYQSAMHADAKDRRLLETDLRSVLHNKGLFLVYQPVVSAKTEQIVGFEALIRWTHPTRGPVSPSVFIPIAEEIGLISQIGEWVIRTACLEAAQWPDPVRVAVNLSPLQFASPALPGIVMSALAASGLPAHRLELEITEGVFLNDSNATDEMFSRLAGIGVRLALDDFGTGYASLGYLKKAPFNKIKIDQSFVRGASIPGNRNAAIIKAIVALADSLEMETTAEGAETHDEVSLIRSLGCSHIQGYIFGKPISSGDAQHLLSRSLIIEPKGFAQSREPRVAILRSAILHDSGRSFNVRVRNVSSGGLMLESDRQIPTGSHIQIEFAEGERLMGEIRWFENGRFGVKLDQTFSLDMLTPPKTGILRPEKAAKPAPAEPLKTERRSGSRAR